MNPFKALASRLPTTREPAGKVDWEKFVDESIQEQAQTSPASPPKRSARPQAGARRQSATDAIARSTDRPGPWAGLIRFGNFVENTLLLIGLMMLIGFGLLVWVVYHAIASAVHDIAAGPQIGEAKVVNPPAAVAQIIPAAPIKGPANEAPIRIEPAPPKPTEAAPVESLQAESAPEVAVEPVVVTATSPGIGEPDRPPPGHPDLYQWMKGWRRPDGTYTKGYWRLKPAGKAKSGTQSSSLPRSSAAIPVQPAPAHTSEAAPPGKVWVNGYTRKDGTKVRGYWRSK